jgi:hypothetical protein
MSQKANSSSSSSKKQQQSVWLSWKVRETPPPQQQPQIRYKWVIENITDDEDEEDEEDGKRNYQHRVACYNYLKKQDYQIRLAELQYAGLFLDW